MRYNIQSIKAVILILKSVFRHCIIPVQTRVYELDNSLLFYHTSLKRLQRHLGIIEQIHMAPSMYVGAVTEVVRRRIFSSSFLRVSTKILKHSECCFSFDAFLYSGLPI